MQLRPGTDAALALGLINVIIEENLYDREFVSRYCHGFAALTGRAKEYPPEKVSEITWIPADTIRAAARLYAGNKPGSIISGMGVEHLENSAEYVHARTILSALVGNMSKVGGDIVHGPHPKMISANEIDAIDRISPEQKKKQIGSDQYKLFTWPGYDMIQENLKRFWGKRGGIFGCENFAPAPLLYRAILSGKPYPVRSLITWDSNPLLTQSNTKLVYKALKSLDLYVVVDFMLTSSADLADYVFPTASWLERPCLWDGYNNANYIIAGERALSPTVEGEYDHGDDYQFWRGLGTRFGQEWPWETMEEVFDYRLSPMDITFSEFMKAGGVDRPPIDYDYYKEKGFATPTGKIELYSTIFEKLGYDPLPAYREPYETPISKPDLAKKYPYILITGGRHRPFFHTEFRQVDRLRNQHPHPLVQIHPADRQPIPDARPAPSKSPAPQPVADEPAIRLNLADDSELLREFHSESLELLQNYRAGRAPAGGESNRGRDDQLHFSCLPHVQGQRRSSSPGRAAGPGARPGVAPRCGAPLGAEYHLGGH